jgi:hypothetical protein
MPEAPEALRHLNNNDSVTPLSPQQKCFKPQSPPLATMADANPITSLPYVCREHRTTRELSQTRDSIYWPNVTIRIS